MGCGASSAAGAAQAIDVVSELPKASVEPPPPKSTGDVASPASTPPSSADTDGAEHDGAEMPLPPGAAAASPGPKAVVTTWNEPEAESSAEPKQEDAKPDMTWLFDAAREGRVEPILEYAQSDSPNLDVRDSDGNTLLHWAVLRGKPTLVSALVDHGVDINALNTRGVTALFYASMLGDGSMVSLLVDQGARVNLHSMGSGAPTEHEVTRRTELIDIELEKEIKLVCTPVQAATVQGHFRVVLFLVQKGADVNIPAHSGNTALHYACMKSFVGLASFLVESGAALDARNDAGAVPADVAEDGMKDLLFEAASPQKSATAPASEPGEAQDGSTPKKQLTFNEDAEIKLIDRVDENAGAEWYKDGPGPWVFGKMFLDTFTSKEWKTRVAALRVLTRDLHVVHGDELLLYKSACAVLNLAFGDKVAQVYLVSLELLRKTLAHFATKLDPEFMREPMNELMATVIPFTGKSQEKVRNESFKAVLFVARQPAVGPAGIAELTLTQKSKKDNPKKWRPLYGRLKILAQMVFEFKFSESNGLTIGSIMDFAAPAFEHQNEQVRKAAVDLFVEAYMLEGAAADGYIATLKPQLQVMIRDELASIDAPVAPVIAEKPPPTASRLTDDTATSRPVTAGARPTTGSAAAAAAGEAMPYAKPIDKDGEAATAHITEFFDDETARCFVAKGWQSRVAALQKIEAKLAEILDPGNTAVVDTPGTADAAYKVVYTALRDPVPHVYTAALGLLKPLAAAPKGQLETTDPGSEVLLGRIVRAVVAKLGDRNSRIRTRTEESLLEMARLPHPYGVEVIANYTLNPTGDKGKDGKGKTEPQLKLLCTLVQQFGLSDEGSMSLDSIMGVTVPAFEDRDKKVRKVAVGVYVSTWKRVGSEALLPYVKHLKSSIRKVLKAKTEGKATSADNAGSEGVNDGGIMFFNADEFNNKGGSGDASGNSVGQNEGAAANAEALPYASSLPDDLREAVKPLAQVFGDDTMQCFYSKQWAPREAALRKVEGQIRMMDGCDRRIFLYVVFMLESALADKIAHVLWGGLSLLRTVVANYAKDLAPVEVQYSMEKLMPNIISQLGNSNIRTRQACEQTCQFLSWKPNVGGAFIARHVLTHDHGKNVTALENKALLLAQLVNDFGVGDESISADELFNFTRPCFEHRNGKVREAAVKIYVAAHKFIGADVNDLIGEVKPALRAVLSKAAMDDPHTNSERPKTPAAFIFDRPSTAAERLSHSLALGGVGLSAAPILAQAGIGETSGGQVSPNEEEPSQTGEIDVSKMPQAQPQTEREKALALERATDAELNELTGLSGSLEVLKRVFGADLLLQFRDKDSSEREEALESMQEAIWSNGPLLGSETDANASFEACCHLAKHALSDKTIGVICAGLELLKTVIVTHSRKLGAFEFRLALGSLATTILGLSADGPIRVRSKSDEMTVFLAHQPKLGIAFLSRYLLENAAAPALMARKDSGRAVVLARLKLLVDLLGEVAAPGTDKSQWPMESVATFCAACIAVHTSVSVKNKAKLVVGLVCSCAGQDGVNAVRRLVSQPPTSDPEQRKRVVDGLEEVLAEHGEKMKEAGAENGASNGPPRGVADPKFRQAGGDFEAADLGRARSAVASSRGNEPEEGAARPTTFGGAVGDTDGLSQAKPFSGLPVGGSGAVLGDLPPITLGLPTGVANEFGRYGDPAQMATSPAPGDRSIFANDPPSPRTPMHRDRVRNSPVKRSPRAGRRAAESSNRTYGSADP